MARARFRPLLLVAALLPLPGCGGSSSDEGVTVTGRVTLDGAPLPGGQVVFEIANPAGQRVGGIAEDGTYEVKGVPEGKVRVAVRTSFLQGQAAAAGKFAQKAGVKAEKLSLVLVPARYENPDTAKLEYTVEAGKPIDIALKR
jgi:hypothetical protein